MAKGLTVIGIMSGTSLDGVDLACVNFIKTKGRWSYTVEAAETKPYNRAWKTRLQQLMHGSAKDYASAHAAFGHHLASLANAFIKKYRLHPDLIASHGHTIFHQPQAGFTGQIGDGSALAAGTGIITSCDFRSTDLAKGGQGAPLVPVGDRLLFGNYDFCLNMGGIANISFESGRKRLAFDICPVNMALNELAGLEGQAYDKDGRLASSGRSQPDLLEQLNGLPYYQLDPPKSLGAEWYENNFRRLLGAYRFSTADKLATVCDHIVRQVQNVLVNWKSSHHKTMLITGGGAHNRFLVDRMNKTLPVKLVLPSREIIDFKEAIVFAFLGALRWQKETNTLRSVTGADSNSCSGALYLP